MDLQRDVETLASDIGQRNLLHYSNFLDTIDFLWDSFAAAGYKPRRHQYDVGGADCFNLDVEVPGNGRADEIVIIGAHFDTVLGCPGAADNASAVACVLALARACTRWNQERTVRLVCFANEEMPYFGSDSMGSMVYAYECRERGDDVVAMAAFEMLGVRPSDGETLFPASVREAWPTGESLVAFAGNEASRNMVVEALDAFQEESLLGSIGGVFAEDHPGTSWSDNRSFWKHGYPGMLIIETGALQYPFYHRETDTTDKLDFDRLALIELDLESSFKALALASP